MLAYTEFHPPRADDPILILHGLFGSGRNWHTIAKTLSLQRSVYCLDLPNHGASPWRETMTYTEMALDVLDLIAVLDLGAPTLIGHSMGGKVAMTLALTRPELVKSLIVVDIAPTAYNHDFLPYLRALGALPLETLASRQQANTLLSAAIADPILRGFLLQNLERNADGWRWRCNLAALERCQADLLDFPSFDNASYHGPTLFIKGEDSSYIHPQLFDGIASLFPKAQRATIPDSGHWIHAQNPEAFLTTVSSFLTQ